MPDRDRKEDLIRLHAKLHRMRTEAKVRDHYHAGAMAMADMLLSPLASEEMADALTARMQAYAKDNA